MNSTIYGHLITKLSCHSDDGNGSKHFPFAVILRLHLQLQILYHDHGMHVEQSGQTQPKPNHSEWLLSSLNMEIRSHKHMRQEENDCIFEKLIA